MLPVAESLQCANTVHWKSGKTWKEGDGVEIAFFMKILTIIYQFRKFQTMLFNNVEMSRKRRFVLYIKRPGISSEYV